MTKEQVQEIEPHVNCLAGIWVKSTGIVDYKQVCQQYAMIAQEQGVDLLLNTCVTGIKSGSKGHLIATNQGEYQTEFLINCGGLYSDRLSGKTMSAAAAHIYDLHDGKIARFRMFADTKNIWNAITN